jgi:hypothetical protein
MKNLKRMSRDFIFFEVNFLFKSPTKERNFKKKIFGKIQIAAISFSSSPSPQRNPNLPNT